jgi:hypothetical protein
MKTKYDARHQLKQLGWTDQELNAIGLTAQDEGTYTIPRRKWMVCYTTSSSLDEP